MIDRAAVVEEARSWLRTPFHHHAAVKGVGVDCAHLIREVFCACGVPVEPAPEYPHDWHLHRDEERFENFVLQYAERIEEAELQPGDILLWRFGRCFAHGAIYIGDGQVIHAVSDARSVILSRLTEEELEKRPRRCYRIRRV